MICLIRHGETEWNYLGKIQGKTDIPLNDRGIQQAEACRNYFKNSDWDVIVSSPLKRARQTADIINKDLGLEIIEMNEFQERSFGDAEGLTIEERAEKYPNGDYPNQETREALQERLIVGLNKMNSVYKGKKVLLVAHGAVINSILTIASNGEIGAGKTRLNNACLSHLELIDDKWKIHNYNQIDHLVDIDNN